MDEGLCVLTHHSPRVFLLQIKQVREKKKQQLNEGDECDRAWQITTKTVENITIRPLYGYFFSKNPLLFFLRVIFTLPPQLPPTPLTEGCLHNNT